MTLLPLAEKLRQLGSEDAAKQVEEFTKQETHHGDDDRRNLQGVQEIESKWRFPKKETVSLHSENSGQPP